MNGENALIDSNIIIYLSKQQISPDFIERFDGLFISVITYMEILGYDFDDPIEDGLVKSQFWDGKVKSSSSRRANLEEWSVLGGT